MYEKKRCAIYVYWDSKGVLRDFAFYYLQELHKHCSRVLCIVNGSLQQIDKEKLKQSGIEVYCRRNDGYDFHAYKYGINLLKLNSLDCDELIITNSSVYGPVRPLEEVFKKMEGSSCDFWGITGHAKTKLFKPHIQSYFVVFKQACLKSKAFGMFWSKLPMFQTRDEAIKKGEVELTDFLSKYGLKWETLIPISQHEKISPEISVLCANLALRFGSPFIKRRVFTTERQHFIAYSNASESLECLEYLKQHSEYDVNLIYDDLIQNYPQSQWSGLIGSGKILPTGYVPDNFSDQELKRAALVLFVYFEDLVDAVVSYIIHLPKNLAVILVSPKKNLLKQYKEKLIFKFEHLELREHPNRGRNETAYFIVCKDVFSNYEYVCLLHDKKCAHLPLEIYGRTFQKHCFDSLIFNSYYIKNIIKIFKDNPKIGLISPPWPIFGYWDGPRSCNFDSNIQEIRKIYRFLDMKVPLDEKIFFPVGTMFWVRSEALSSFFKHNWMIEDFPEEPLKTDGTILHALERMYCLFAQDSGYYSTWVLPDKYACTYIENLLLKAYPENYCSLDSSIQGKVKVTEKIVTYKQLKIDIRLFLTRKIKEFSHRWMRS